LGLPVDNNFIMCLLSISIHPLYQIIAALSRAFVAWKQHIGIKSLAPHIGLIHSFFIREYGHGIGFV